MRKWIISLVVGFTLICAAGMAQTTEPRSVNWNVRYVAATPEDMLNVSIAYMESFLTRLKHVQVTEIVVDVQGGSVRITGTSEL